MLAKRGYKDGARSVNPCPCPPENPHPLTHPDLTPSTPSGLIPSTPFPRSVVSLREARGHLPCLPKEAVGPPPRRPKEAHATADPGTPTCPWPLPSYPPLDSLPGPGPARAALQPTMPAWRAALQHTMPAWRRRPPTNQHSSTCSVTAS